MLIRTGRFGRFLACERYPECKTTQPVPTGVPCPEADCDGQLVEKRTRRGRVFYGCNQYPKCSHALWDPPLARACPACGHPLMVRKETKRDGPHLLCPACKNKVPEVANCSRLIRWGTTAASTSTSEPSSAGVSGTGTETYKSSVIPVRIST